MWIWIRRRLSMMGIRLVQSTAHHSGCRCTDCCKRIRSRRSRCILGRFHTFRYRVSLCQNTIGHRNKNDCWRRIPGNDRRWRIYDSQRPRRIRLISDKTVIITAHRMRAVQEADRIVVLKGGGVAEQSSPEELRQKDAVFANMVRLQTGSESWSLKRETA